MSMPPATVFYPYPILPKSVELEAETKKRVISGVKTALLRLQKEFGFPAQADYSGVLSQPALLQDFLVACAEHMGVLADLAVDGKGQAVTDPNQPLACKVTLAQIRQLLIHTCAKRLFTEAEGERKLNALRPYLAFDWQLPLLKFYYFSLEHLQITELNRDLLLLTDPDQLDAVSRFDVRSIRLVRRMLEGEFPLMLMSNPLALGGLAIAQSELLPMFREALGDRVWDFYARDQDFLERMEQLEPGYVYALGPLLADVAPEVVRALIRLAPDRLRTVLEVFRRVVGEDAERLLRDASFGRQTLPLITQNFAEMDVDHDRLVELLEMKFMALKLAVQQTRARGN